MHLKILLLATGGTIASVPGTDGLAPGLGASALLDRACQSMSGLEIVPRDCLHLDSVNIQPHHWYLLAQEVRAAQDRFHGVVITHGTDTMAYTSAALSFMLAGLSIPVVLTGSQVPIGQEGSDGPHNLADAVRVAASERPGVYLVFNREIIRGCRASKPHSNSWSPFSSINAPLEGRVHGGQVQFFTPGPLVPAVTACHDVLETRVLAVKLLPGLDAGILEYLLPRGYRGLILESYGLGGLPSINRSNLLPGIESWLQAGLPVVIGTQCGQGPVDLDRYQVGRQAAALGAIPGKDMSREVLAVKLMWVLGQTRQLPEVRSLMLNNICGETTEK